MDVLQNKAQQAVDASHTEKVMRAFLKEKYNIKNKRHIEFFIEFMKSGVAYKAYMKVYAPTMANNVARVMASKLMKQYDISFEDWLDYAGHGTDSINEALSALKDKNPDDYLKHITKLKQLDVKKVHVSGEIKMPKVIIEGYDSHDN